MGSQENGKGAISLVLQAKKEIGGIEKHRSYCQYWDRRSPFTFNCWKAVDNRAGSSTHRKRGVTSISRDNVRETGYYQADCIVFLAK